LVTVETVSNQAEPTSRHNDQSELTFGGLVALWTEGFGREVWPSELAIPELDTPDLLPDAVETARVIARSLRSPDSELRQLWEAGPDGGAAFDRHLDELEAALARAAERHPWSGAAIPRTPTAPSLIEQKVLEALGPEFLTFVEELTKKSRD
jgi:hypothetical protein